MKIQFRNMAMMVPDYALIAEIRLFSFGYDKSKPLSQKLVSTFRLSSEQLSSQDHYDFGMRAVNTVIMAAGIKKKNEPDMQEDLQMLSAMRDSNLPKFLRDDIILFRAIIKDLFPGVVEPQAFYEKLEAELDACAAENNLQSPVDFTIKCIQLYEMTTVRHGMMTVGPTGGGKTKVLRTLQAAMSRCVEDDGSWVPGFEKAPLITPPKEKVSIDSCTNACSARFAFVFMIFQFFVDFYDVCRFLSIFVAILSIFGQFLSIFCRFCTYR